MHGHASEDEIEYVKKVEQRITSERDPEALLELGVLYIEPVHNEAEAIKLLEEISKLLQRIFERDSGS